jgi:DNA-binding helix-hairpin-helix protein with protein kinase domain
MAPEAYKSRGEDFKSHSINGDIYSLGVILFELLIDARHNVKNLKADASASNSLTKQ